MRGARHFTTAAGESATARRNVSRAPTAPIGTLRHCGPLQKIDAVGTLAKAVEADARFAPNNY